jgi:hypothetical protein
VVQFYTFTVQISPYSTIWSIISPGVWAYTDHVRSQDQDDHRMLAHGLFHVAQPIASTSGNMYTDNLDILECQQSFRVSATRIKGHEDVEGSPYE